MPIHQEEDYFVPALAPYVQWVEAYSQLISTLYEQHKTARKVWKAFREAVPWVERRLEFDVFEQILLFSLFLSEWNKRKKGSGSAEQGGQTKRSSSPYGGKDPDSQLDTVLQKLQEVIEERDRALWNLKHYEQNGLVLKDQKTHLERKTVSLEKSLEMLQDELNGANEHLRQVIHELDSHKGENAVLSNENNMLKDREASLKRVIDRLRKKLGRLTSCEVQTQQIAAVKEADAQEGAVQAIIQWEGQTPGQKVIQKADRKPHPKKVGSWNAQYSKDGYYRLYRKIRGKVHSIYIGKVFDVDKAVARIAEKESKLLAPDRAPAGPDRVHGKGQTDMPWRRRVIDDPRDPPATKPGSQPYHRP